jgi:mutator protein MutT
MKDLSVEMHFCRRCGSKFVSHDNHVYRCAQGHVIFLNASPAVGVVLFNDAGEVLILERAIEPGLGLFDIPGGFCDGAETVESAVVREIREEVGIEPNQYRTPEFISSGIDPYEYGGEVLPVVGIMFQAQLIGEVHPVAADDAASAKFIALGAIDMDKVYFPAVRGVLEKLRG